MKQTIIDAGIREGVQALSDSRTKDAAYKSLLRCGKRSSADDIALAMTDTEANLYPKGISSWAYPVLLANLGSLATDGKVRAHPEGTYEVIQ